MLGLDFNIVSLAIRRNRVSPVPTSFDLSAWYDPSDLSTMFQDAAMTTPVSANGEPVGALLDRSGNDNHLVQPIAAARPTYTTDGTQHWLHFDGIDDALTGPQLPYASSATVGVGFEALSAPSGYPIVTRNGAEATDGSGRQPMVYLDSSSPNIIKVWWGNKGLIATLPQSVIAEGKISLVSQTETSTALLDVNGAMQTVTGVTLVSNPANNLAVGKNKFHGRIFGIVYTKTALSTEERAALSQYLDLRSGRVP